jgi:hypothetical protein
MRPEDDPHVLDSIASYLLRSTCVDLPPRSMSLPGSQRESASSSDELPPLHHELALNVAKTTENTLGAPPSTDQSTTPHYAESITPTLGSPKSDSLTPRTLNKNTLRLLGFIASNQSIYPPNIQDNMPLDASTAQFYGDLALFATEVRASLLTKAVASLTLKPADPVAPIPKLDSNLSEPASLFVWTVNLV